MLAAILGWMTVAGLLILLGASVYVSFFMHREPPPPVIRRKQKLAFGKAPKGVEFPHRRRNTVAA